MQASGLTNCFAPAFADGRLLYVGKSVNLRQRLRSYFRGLPKPTTTAFSDNARTVEASLPTSSAPLPSLEPASGLGLRQATMVRLARSLETIVTVDAAQALMLEVSC